MNSIKDIAIKAVYKAGDYLKESFKNCEVREKSTSYDLVTDADIRSQEIIYEVIKSNFPDHSFLGEEENSHKSVEKDNLWIVDPIDGTNNFAHGIPHFSISIAYAEKGEVILGVVYDPFRNELFHSLKGEGAYINDDRISVTTIKSLTKAVIGTGFYYDRGGLMERTLETIKKLFKYPIQGIRRNGSAALDIVWVACGRFDAFFEYQLSVWDFAAGLLIAEEAGAVITDCSGVKNGLKNKNIAVCGKNIYKDFLEIIKE